MLNGLIAMSHPGIFLATTTDMVRRNAWLYQKKLRDNSVVLHHLHRGAMDTSIDAIELNAKALGVSHVEHVVNVEGASYCAIAYFNDTTSVELFMNYLID